MSPEEIAEGLGPVLARALDAPELVVEEARTMTGGAAREAWRLRVSPRPGAEAADFVALLFRGVAHGAFGAAQEARLLERASATGVPVPRVVAAGEEELGRPFYLMEFLEGETIGRRLVREERFEAIRPSLPGQMAAALAAIHRLSPDDAELSFLPAPPSGQTVAGAAVDKLEQIYRMVSVEPHPVFEVALMWLRRRLPPTVEPTLVHGDFRVGNLMVHPERGLVAVLDWELAHFGDPVEDLAWACVRSWRFGADRSTCGGVGRREDLLAAYETATGRRVDLETFRFWEVFGNLNWGVITLMQLRPFVDGTLRNVELAAIGRRASETEWELLNLIEGKGD